MKLMSARSSRAPVPRIRVKRDSAIFTPRSKSRMPRAVPTSQWGRGSKENSRGSPQRRTSRLEFSSRPTGTDSWGMLGTHSTREASFSSTSLISFSSASIRSETCFISARRPSMSPPDRAASPISLETRLRRVRSSSASVVSPRRFTSRDSSSSRSSRLLRSASDLRTASGFSRMNFRSSTIPPPLPGSAGTSPASSPRAACSGGTSRRMPPPRRPRARRSR